MDAVPEREVAVVRASDIEPFGVAEPCSVAVRGCQGDDDLPALRDRQTADVGGAVPGEQRDVRRRQTQIPVEVVDQAKFERSETWEAA